MPPPPKTCLACGREITWRKKWERDWAQVRYCSDGCRRRKVGAAEHELEAAVLRLAAAPGGVSDVAVARQLAGEGWRDRLEPVRRAARRLVEQGRAELVQQGRVVDPSRARGEVWIRLLS